MMFWQHLLAASSLTAGTVWDLITHPNTGSGGQFMPSGATTLVTQNDITQVTEVDDDSVTIIDALR